MTDKGHYCPECGARWEHGAGEPCGRPLILPCPALGCDLDWRDAVDEDQLPYPEFYAMARSIYPWQALPHHAGYPPDYFEWLVWHAFSVLRIERI